VVVFLKKKPPAGARGFVLSRWCRTA